MPGYTDYGGGALLGHEVGKTAWTMPTYHIGLFTVMPNEAGAGGTEVSGGSYARKATAGADWNAPSGSGPRLITNANDIVFALSTAAWGTVIGWGGFDALSGGNLIRTDFLGDYNWLPFTCTLASPGVLTVPNHGFANGDLVAVSGELGTLPTTGGSWSGLLTVANVTTHTFTVGVNTTSVGSGTVRKVKSQVVPDNNRLTLAAGTLILAAA